MKNKTCIYLKLVGSNETICWGGEHVPHIGETILLTLETNGNQYAYDVTKVTHVHSMNFTRTSIFVTIEEPSRITLHGGPGK